MFILVFSLGLPGLTVFAIAFTFATEAFEVKKGDTVLIYAAAGGVGLILTQVRLPAALSSHTLNIRSSPVRAECRRYRNRHGLFSREGQSPS